MTLSYLILFDEAVLQGVKGMVIGKRERSELVLAIIHSNPQDVLLQKMWGTAVDLHSSPF